MSNKQLPNRHKISAKEVRKLLSDGQWAEDEALSKLFYGQVYLHSDGRALTVLFDK